MKFVVDAQLPPSLAQWLMDRPGGHQAQHVQEVGLRDSEDGEIWDYALQEKAVIMTKDEDFAARRARSAQGPVIVWLHVGNCSNEELFLWLEKLWPSLFGLLGEKNHLIELRREHIQG